MQAYSSSSSVTLSPRSTHALQGIHATQARSSQEIFSRVSRVGWVSGVDFVENDAEQSDYEERFNATNASVTQHCVFIVG
jgi:hypothetical protein